MINLFALTKDPENQVYRIQLSQDIQQEISNLFLQQKEAFIEDKEVVPFSGSYKAEVDEIFQIQNYEVPNFINQAISQPLNCERLSSPENVKICALFAGDSSGEENYICFQVFDSRRLITNRGFSIVHSGGTYHRFDDSGFTIAESLTALHSNGSLFFNSYHNTKRFLNLIPYFEEATDADVNQFTQNPLFNIEDTDSFKESADSIIRTKIKLIQTNGTLNNVSIQDIRQKAEEFGLAIAIVDERVQIPNNRREIKELIRFLDEDYFVSSLTNTKYVTNSKRTVN